MPLIIGIIVLVLLFEYLKENPAIAVILGLSSAALMYLLYSKSKIKAIENQNIYSKFIEEATTQIQSLTNKHIEALFIKNEQSITQDEYGNHVFEKWFQAQDYFIENILCKDSLIADLLSDSHNSQIRIANIRRIIDDAVDEYKAQLANNNNFCVNVDALDPTQFEHYCADILRNCGWNARVTQASGDQGIDVIATFGNVKAVLQCKKYSRPVGNAAVQEIFAGKAFEQAQVAAVVSNADFTPSAKRLAAIAGVFLMHHSQLPSLA